MSERKKNLKKCVGVCGDTAALALKRNSEDKDQSSGLRYLAGQGGVRNKV